MLFSVDEKESTDLGRGGDFGVRPTNAPVLK